MMRNTNQNNIIKVLLLSLVILSGCASEKQYFYYAYYYDEHAEPESYFVRVISIDGEVRHEEEFWVDENGVLEKEGGDLLIKTSTGLNKRKLENGVHIYSPYLDISKNECVEFKYSDASLNDFASTTFCFIEKKDIVVNGMKYHDAYRFKKIVGSNNGVVTDVYLDENFILISQECTEGERAYYRIDRVDSAFMFQSLKLNKAKSNLALP